MEGFCFDMVKSKIVSPFVHRIAPQVLLPEIPGPALSRDALEGRERKGGRNNKICSTMCRRYCLQVPG